MQTARPYHAIHSKQAFRYPTPTDADDHYDQMKPPHEEAKGGSKDSKDSSLTPTSPSTSGSEYIPQLQSLQLERDLSQDRPQYNLGRHRTKSADSISRPVPSHAAGTFPSSSPGISPIRLRRSDSGPRSISSSSSFRPDSPEYRRSHGTSPTFNENDSRYYPYPRVYHQYSPSLQYSPPLQNPPPPQQYSPPHLFSLPQPPPHVYPQSGSVPPLPVPIQPLPYPYPHYPPHTQSLPASPDSYYFQPRPPYWTYPQTPHDHPRHMEPPIAPAPVAASSSSHTEAEEAYPPGFKPKRKRADANQTRVLNEVFKNTRFPKTELRQQLAQQLKMTPRTVQIWFQNKRQSEKAKGTQDETETDRPSMDVLASGAVGQQASDQEDEEEVDEVEDPTDSSFQDYEYGQHYDAIRDVVSSKDTSKRTADDTRKRKGKDAEG